MYNGFRQHALVVFPFLILALLGCNRTPSQKENGPGNEAATQPKTQNKGAEPPGQQAQSGQSPGSKEVSPPKQKSGSKEVSFPKQKIEFDLPPGWNIAKKEVAADQSSCVLTREVDGAVKTTVGIWAGESFATEAIAKGSIILYGKKAAKGSPQESVAGAAWANQKVMSLALGRDYQPDTTNWQPC